MTTFSVIVAGKAHMVAPGRAANLVNSGRGVLEDSTPEEHHRLLDAVHEMSLRQMSDQDVEAGPSLREALRYEPLKGSA